MKKRILGYFISAASVYLAMNYLTRLFINLVSNFTISII
jgi:hypothetical protein